MMLEKDLWVRKILMVEPNANREVLGGIHYNNLDLVYEMLASGKITWQQIEENLHQLPLLHATQYDLWGKE